MVQDSTPLLQPLADRNHFEELFRTYYPGLLRFATAQLSDRSRAEDAVHDVFLRLWSQRRSLPEQWNPRLYLLTSLRNRITDLRRRQGLEERWMDPLPSEPIQLEQWIPQAHSRTTLADPAELAQLEEAIRSAVNALPDRCRTAFLLCRQQDLSYAEAAEVMGVSPATVKTQIARALAALRSHLAPFLSLLLAGALM